MSSNNNVSMNCRICGTVNPEPVYIGKIRDGRFPSLTPDSYHVLECKSCKGRFLNQLIEEETYYVSEQYRKEVDGSSVVEDFHALHDREHLKILPLLDLQEWRGKKICDVGAGGGSFLDIVKGFSSELYAVEPSATFQGALRKKGIKTFPFLNDAKDIQESIDVCACFSVIEHINEPLEFLRGIKKLMKKDGVLYLTTPNFDDVLMTALPDIYPAFFYRKVHSIYFNPESLISIFKLAGFKEIEIKPFQRYGLSNFINWVNHKKPMGENILPFVTSSSDAIWKKELERQNFSDYLVVKAKV